MSPARNWLAVSLTLTAGLVAQQPEPRDPADVMRAIDGREWRGTFAGVGSDGIVQFEAPDGAQRLALDEIQQIVLRPRGGATPPAGIRSGVWLRSGQALPALLAAAGDKAGQFSWGYSDERLELPWRYLQAVLFDTDAGADKAFLAAIANPPRDSDWLYAYQGEGEVRRYTMEFLGVDGDLVLVRFDGTEQTVGLDRVHGVVFGEQSGTRPDVQANPRVRLALADGSTLDGAVAEMDAMRCRLRLDEGVTVGVPTAVITRIGVQSDKLVYLGDLESKVEQTPAFDRTWPPLWDHGPGGGPIRLGGQQYSRGVVLVPRTVLEYRVDQRFDVFEAMIGLEERAGATANAVFRVRGDGEVLYDSGAIASGAAPVVLTIPVTGVARLTLEADFGENLDLGDLCVFANPRLLKK